MLGDLRADTGDSDACFRFIFLMDDFVGSGKTLLRRSNGGWIGKLVKFWENVSGRLATHCEDNLVIGVHHYLATDRAQFDVQERYREACAEREPGDWFRHVEFSFGALLPPDFPISKSRDAAFMALIDRYYDPSVETRHTDDVRLGFGKCALPLVLEHNTPNNSIALLWAETKGADDAHAMRPLFRRRERHT